MLPSISLGPVVLPLYWLAMSLGILVGGFVVVRRLQRAGLSSDRSLVFVAVTLLAGALGAQGFHVVLERALPLLTSGQVVMQRGLTVTGCLVAIPVMVWLARRFRLAIGAAFDAVLPVMALGQAFGRLGCAAAGCCAGQPTESWMAVISPGKGGVWAPRFPAQLVASAADLAIFVLLMVVERRWPRRPFIGFLGGLFLVLAALKRLVIEFVREEAVIAAGLTWAQLIAVAVLLMAVGAIVVAWRLSRASSSQLECGS